MQITPTPAQTPAEHTSPCVQALPSSHGVPSAWLGFEQLSICEFGSVAVAEHALANKTAAIVVSGNDKNESCLRMVAPFNSV
ncbi:MAG TPA: hypothetical protein PKI03_28770 [Pseudomonadota bacterium]|nr:hypothetical protein [Pseudomonadota bacterium]